MKNILFFEVKPRRNKSNIPRSRRLSRYIARISNEAGGWMKISIFSLSFRSCILLISLSFRSQQFSHEENWVDPIPTLLGSTRLLSFCCHIVQENKSSRLFCCCFHLLCKPREQSVHSVQSASLGVFWRSLLDRWWMVSESNESCKDFAAELSGLHSILCLGFFFCISHLRGRKGCSKALHRHRRKWYETGGVGVYHFRNGTCSNIYVIYPNPTRLDAKTEKYAK